LEHIQKLCDLMRRQQTGFFFALSPELLSRLVPLAALKAECPEMLSQMVQRWLNCGVAEQGRLVPLADLQTFGAYKFCLNDNCCDLSEVGQSSRLLLALLAVSPNNSMSSELLMSTLWPDSPPSKARNSFDTALSRLRRALESYFGKQIREDYLQLEKGMLLLRNLRIDRNEFLSEMARAQRHLQRQNLWQAELALWKAEQIWQGEFLTGFELDAELPYRQDELNQLRLEQLTGLAELLRRRGDFSEAVRLLQLGLQLEPTHDGLIQQLLDLYYQLGDQRAAKQLLEGYRGVLEKEDYDVEEIDELITALSRQWLEL
jgi:DNA-binding SARP family transcriptional activator